MTHGHGHGSQHDPGSRRVLAIVLAITCVVLLVEIVGAIWSGSLALLADAGHMLTDVAGLTLALIAAVLVQRPPTDQLTWGYRRAEVLAAAAQAAVLLAVGAFILIEGVQRLIEPPEVTSGLMIVFGVVGLIGNSIAIGVLSRAGSDNLNMRAALLEVVNDALGSVAVLVAAVIIASTGWTRADALASLVIGVLIIPRTWGLLRETVDVLLESTPRGVDLAEVRAHILAVPHVQALHDLHASTVASGLPVLTVHVVVDDECFHDGHLTSMLDQMQGCLAGHFDVEHSTFQFEPASHLDHEHAAHP
ncbi:MAG TPA: cation diffusion facilitator family transporter [Kineosporiaceae bacterium]|nr:cation diffusion facilitator family transporter [Kineosporiaceae bacterium]